MHKHVRSCLPNEACGLLAGIRNHVHWVIPVVNVEMSSIRFRMDPHEQVAAMMRIEEKGMELMGIYHSHPSGPQNPSETDIDQLAYPDAAYLIWFFRNGRWICRAFAMKPEGPNEIQIHLLE